MSVERSLKVPAVEKRALDLAAKTLSQEEIASRLKSDEVASGLANAISLPMMLLSGVWFSLEGSPEWIVSISKLLPLTHVVDASRAIMLDGAGLMEISHHLLMLLLMMLVFLFIGVKLFRWN